MALRVQKFGGTSVGSLDRIQRVADRVAQCAKQGDQVVVVVSAISGETDKLLKMGKALSEMPAEREMDVLVSTGEQVSSALLAIALNERGIQARSLLGHQAQIHTDDVHTKARIHKIQGEAILSHVHEGNVVVIAGFQGKDSRGNITTLGRGGSDTTAVAIAAAIGADVCEIFTDVDGVYTTDPNVCSNARKIPRISFEEMLELASLGAKVLQIRSVELAMKYNVPIHVRSSFNDLEGTMVVSEETALEAITVTGVAADKKEVKVTIRSLPDTPGVVASLFEKLAEASVSVDMIIQNVSRDETTDLTFTIGKDDISKTKSTVESALPELSTEDLVIDENVVKISIVGLGMRSHAGVAAKMFRLLADEGINIEAISTSEIKVSCLILHKYAELAVRTLHDGFELDKLTIPPAKP